MTPGDAYEAAIRYCNAVGGSGLTSSYRTPARNARVGGVPTSRHLDGTGFDVGFEDGAGAGNETRRTIAARLGFLLVIEDDHDHLQPL